MPTKSSTVACPLYHLIREQHLPAIEDAVRRTHESVVIGSALLNVYVRRVVTAFLNDPTPQRRIVAVSQLGSVFTQSVVANALVLASGGTCTRAPPSLSLVWSEMRNANPNLSLPGGSGTNYLRAYEARSMVATAKTALKMHFYRRVQRHVKMVHRIERSNWLALTADERKAHKLQFARMTADIVRRSIDPLKSSPIHHLWIQNTRRFLGLDLLLTNNKPLAYHLESSPGEILFATARLSYASFRTMGKGFALFPLRTAMTPRFCNFCVEALCQATGIRRAERAERPKRAAPGSVAAETIKASRLAEKRATFQQVLRPGWEKRVGHSDRFVFSFKTDGFSARLLLESDMPDGLSSTTPSGSLPRRGVHYIDDLRTRVDGIRPDMDVIGVDPGKIELMVACNDRKTSPTDPRPLHRPVRYTNKQRRYETKTEVAQKKLLAERTSSPVFDLECDLARHCKRDPTLESFNTYVNVHFASLRARLDFYARLSFRKRRWRGYVLSQKSIARLKNRVRNLVPKGKRFAIAWGAWGLTSGSACSRGNPPAFGIGLMKEFAKDFLVIPTPEHHTSKTCSVCLRSRRGAHDAGPCAEVEAFRGERVRGLRFCQTCSSHLNRDANASLNIAMNLRCFMAGEGGIRTLTPDEAELIRADAAASTN